MNSDLNALLNRFPSYKVGNLPKRFEDTISTVKGKLLEMKVQNIEAILVFGSVSRGVIKSSSDVDILVILNEPIKDRVLMATIKECEDDNPCDVDITVMYYANLLYSNTFNRNIMRDSKLIWRR